MKLQRKNKRGQAIIINMAFFFMALVVLVMFISPVKTFLGMAMGSNNLNCQGYADPAATASVNYSYNATKNPTSDTLSCLAIKLYLPYILMVFLIGGVIRLLYDKSVDFLGGGSSASEFGGTV